jgi:hypothetical protein
MFIVIWIKVTNIAVSASGSLDASPGHLGGICDSAALG